MKVRILIVDDNEDIHDLIKTILVVSRRTANSDYQYEVDSAYQGQEALKLTLKAAHEGNPYSLIMIDMRMPPGWNGYETAQRILAALPHSKILICSAYSDVSLNDFLVQEEWRGKVFSLEKPFKMQDLVLSVSSITTQWLHEREAFL